MDIQEQNVPSCAENIGEIGDVEEEHCAMSGSSAADTAFNAVISCMEDIIIQNEFQQLQHSFMDKHYQEFDESDENKLSYTPIFKEYVGLLKKHLEQPLMERIPGFNMNTFMELVTQRKDEVPGDIFAMLLAFTDFMAFKEMFVEYRAAKEGRVLDMSQALVVASLMPAGSKHASEPQ